MMTRIATLQFGTDALPVLRRYGGDMSSNGTAAIIPDVIASSQRQGRGTLHGLAFAESAPLW